MNRKSIAIFLAGATVTAGAVALSGSTAQTSKALNGAGNIHRTFTREVDDARPVARYAAQFAAEEANSAAASATAAAAKIASPSRIAFKSAATSQSNSGAAGLPSSWRQLPLLSTTVPVNVAAALPNFELYTGPQGPAYDVNLEMNGKSLKDAQVESNMCLAKVDGSCAAVSTASLPAHQLNVPLPVITVANGEIDITVSLGYYAQDSLSPVFVDGSGVPGSLVRISQPMLIVDAGWQLIGTGRVHHTVQIPLV